MQAHAIDTLEATNALKKAGANEKLAVAIVRVFDGAAQSDKAVFATKEDIATVHTEIATVRTEIATVRTEVANVRTELKEEIGAVRTELKEEIGAVRIELKEEIGAVRTEIEKSKVQIIVMMIATMGIFSGIVTGIFSLIAK